MKRLFIAIATLAFSAAAVALPAPPASATIHPIMLGWVCGAASGNPPGQTPGENHAEQSTLRALQATGVLTFTAAGPRHRPHASGVEVHHVRSEHRYRGVGSPWVHPLRRPLIDFICR